MKKKVLIGISCVVIIVAIVCVCVNYLKPQDTKNNINNANISIVTSLEDKIGENTAWCGTFNLIWNDLKNDLVKQDIKFGEELEIVNNLNKGTFTNNELSENSYYKTYGMPSLELKAKIEKAIKEKFNETSAILDSFEWENHSEDDYFLYAMLKKDFEYPKVFDKLDNGAFEEYNNVKYFGITGTTKEQVREQVKILYYNSEDDFAFKIKTNGEDEIIVSVGNEKDNFLDIYNTIISESANYNGIKSFGDNDTLKMPYISFNLNKEITEVELKPFYFADGRQYWISKALQTIEFELDEKGGRIKSEAGMMVDNTSAAMPLEPKHFNVDQTFTIFLIEKDKGLPYFAAKISDISSVQSDVEINEEYKEPSSGEYKENSTQAYIPDGMEIATKDDVGGNTEKIEFNRKQENVTVEVLEDTITPSGATIMVTDTNENPYGWGKSYKLQQKIVDEWYDAAPINVMSFEEIAYELDENGQFKQNIDWTKFYGVLGKGKFRIVKDTYDNGYIHFYSNEFEIK